MIKTYNLHIYMAGNAIHYDNISRVAVKRYLEYYRENENFLGYALDDA